MMTIKQAKADWMANKAAAEHYTPLPVADDIEFIRAERDVLARRIQSHRGYIDQQNQIIRRLSAGALSAAAAVDAIRQRADDDGALHFDAIREVLIGLGARP